MSENFLSTRNDQEDQSITILLIDEKNNLKMMDEIVNIKQEIIRLILTEYLGKGNCILGLCRFP